MKRKDIFNNFFLVFMVLALCVPGITKDKIVESEWITNSIKIDGS